MFKKLSLFLVCVFTITSVLAGCGGGNVNTDNTKSGNQAATQAQSTATSQEQALTQGKSTEEKLAADQTLRLKLNDEPTSLDPAMFQDSQAENVAQCVYETLFRNAKNDKGYEPGLATDFKLSDDKMTYTFNLKKDAKFDDGTPITANDVVYTVLRTLDPKTGAQRAFDFYEIKNAEAYNKGKVTADQVGIKAIDDYTVEMKLRRVLDYWIGITCRASFGIISKASCEKNGKLYGTDADKLSASGPFKMESWNHESDIVLVKNPNYWDAQNVTLNKIEMKIVKDNTTASGLYKTGALDFLDIASDNYQEYKSSPEFNSIPAAGTQFIEINPKMEFMKNVKIRQALALTINRKLFTDQILKTGEAPAYGLVPPGIKGKDNGDFRSQSGNLFTDIGIDPSQADNAKKLLAQGLSEIGKTQADFDKTVKMHCVDSPNAKRFAQAIQQMWKDNLGANIEIVPLQIPMLLPILRAQTFQIIIGGGRQAPVNDPEDFIKFVYDENKWDDAEYKHLIEVSLITSGNERMDALMKAEKMLIDNAVFIPEYHAAANFVVKPYVKGYARFGVGNNYDWKYTKILQK